MDSLCEAVSVIYYGFGVKEGVTTSGMRSLAAWHFSFTSGVCRSTIIGEPTSVGNCMIVKPIADPRDGCMEIQRSKLQKWLVDVLVAFPGSSSDLGMMCPLGSGTNQIWNFISASTLSLALTILIGTGTGILYVS